MELGIKGMTWHYQLRGSVTALLTTQRHGIWHSRYQWIEGLHMPHIAISPIFVFWSPIYISRKGIGMSQIE